MTQTTMTPMSTDLDLLAERVEKAAALIQSMREDRQKLERERDELARTLQESAQHLLKVGQERPHVVEKLTADQLGQTPQHQRTAGSQSPKR